MSGLSTAKADREQLGSLKAELARIGDLIETGKRRLKNLEIDAAEEARLRDVLPQLKKSEEILRDSIARLTAAETQARNGTQRATGSLKAVSDAYKSTSELHAAATGRKARAERQVEILEGDAEAIKAGNRERGREEISKTDPAIVSANTILAKVRSDIASAKRQLATMDSKRKAHTRISNDIENLTNRAKKLDRKILDGERKLKKTEASIADVDAEIYRKRKAFDAECAKKTSDIDAREKDLMQREGTLDRVKKWVKEKGGLLKQAKTEIENYHGKALNHIIIPELDD